MRLGFAGSTVFEGSALGVGNKVADREVRVVVDEEAVAKRFVSSSREGVGFETEGSIFASL